MNQAETHEFYCIMCGERGICLSRPNSLRREKFHRKKLWCINCKMETNHIECQSDEEVKQFKELYNEGYFQKEAEIYR